MSEKTSQRRFLSELAKGESGTITAVGSANAESTDGTPDSTPDSTMVRRLLEMGILEGSRVEVVHEAPFGRDPLAIRVRGALIALRRHEAAHIEVEVP